MLLKYGKLQAHRLLFSIERIPVERITIESISFDSIPVEKSTCRAPFGDIL